MHSVVVGGGVGERFRGLHIYSKFVLNVIDVA